MSLTTSISFPSCEWSLNPNPFTETNSPDSISKVAIELASCKEIYALLLLESTVIYSGSKSTDGFASFINITLSFKSSSLLSSNFLNVANFDSPLSRLTIVTEPCGSTIPSPTPSLGSPSLAVKIYFESGVYVIISGWTPHS